MILFFYNLTFIFFIYYIFHMKRTLLILCILTGAIANSYSFGYASIDCDNANELGQEDIIVNRASCREYNLDNLITRQEVAAISLKIGEAC